MDKLCIILRGLPGSGKSTFANSIKDNYKDYTCRVFETDEYFDLFCDGEFVPSLLSTAHDWNYNCFCNFVHASNTVHPELFGDQFLAIVSNTSTQEWEFEKYKKVAENNGFTVISLIVENRHEGNSIHNVPDNTIDKMRNRFEVNL